MILELFQISLDKYKALRYATEAVYIHKLPEREQKMSKGHTLTKKRKFKKYYDGLKTSFLSSSVL